MIVEGSVYIGEIELILGPPPVSNDAAKGHHWVRTHSWHGTGGSKAEVIEQTSNSGAFPLGPGWRESVLVSFEGFSWGRDRADYRRLRNELTALGAEKNTVLVRLVDCDEDTWRDGHVVAVEVADDRGTDRFTWSIDVRCADPRRYGPVQERREALSAGGTQYSLAGNGKPSSTDGWYASVGADSRLSPDGVSDRMVYKSFASARDKLALFYRVSELTYPVKRVRLFVAGDAGGKVRLSLSWLADGVLRRVEGFQPVALSGDSAPVLIDATVSQPAGVNGLTVGVEQYDPSLPSLRSLRAGSLMVGAFTDEEFQDGDSLGWAWLGEPNKSVAAQLGTRWPLDNTTGTAPSTPAIRVYAIKNLDKGFTLSFYGSDEKLVYPGSIKAGSVVELLPGEHAVLIDGRLSPLVAVGTWPVVPPGELVQLSLTANSASDFEATSIWAPAWW